MTEEIFTTLFVEMDIGFCLHAKEKISKKISTEYFMAKFSI